MTLRGIGGGHSREREEEAKGGPGSRRLVCERGRDDQSEISRFPDLVGSLQGLEASIQCLSWSPVAMLGADYMRSTEPSLNGPFIIRLASGNVWRRFGVKHAGQEDR